MKNCGKRFHSEVGKFRFLNELIKVVSPKVGLPGFRELYCLLHSYVILSFSSCVVFRLTLPRGCKEESFGVDLQLDFGVT